MPNAPDRPPLAGIKVLDLSRLMAGPWCGQMLGDYGADVIKVEPPDGDRGRRLGKGFFESLNRSKRSIALDIADARGREVFLGLLQDADVLINNFKPGTLEKWGLGFDALHARFPRLVVVSVTGFGATGPLGGMPATDGAVAAWSGLLSLNGDEQTAPMRFGVPLVDLTTGMQAVIGVMLALFERDRSGLGQHVDVTLFDSALSIAVPTSTHWLQTGEDPLPSGNHNTNAAPYGTYRCGDGLISIGASTNRSFAALCEVVDRTDLIDDARFADEAARVRNLPALIAELERTFASWNSRELAVALVRRDVVAGPVLPLRESLTDAHTLHREMVVRIDDYASVGIPIKLSRSPGQVTRKPPRFAEHRHEVLQQSGYDGDEAQRLEADGIVPATPAVSRTARRRTPPA